MSYRIGWVYVHRTEVVFHVGNVMNVPAGLAPNRVKNVPDQAVLPDTAAERVVFFVSELTLPMGGTGKPPNRLGLASRRLSPVLDLEGATGQPGRPLISREVRDLIRKMCRGESRF